MALTVLGESGDYMIGVFLDFSKASDTVDHDILLKKYVTMEFGTLVLNGFRVTCLSENNM